MTGKCLPKVPNSPFAPIVPLFLETVDSDLSCFLEEVHILIQQTPALLEAVDKDLDAHALGKKADRIAEAQWYDNRSLPLRGILDPPQDPEKPLALKTGRPRTPASVVLVALFLRGYSGSGFKAADVTSFMLESITLRVFFTNESLMFTLKHGFDFGEVARRGLSAVHAELMEKALAYNICVTVRLRKAVAVSAMSANVSIRAVA